MSQRIPEIRKNISSSDEEVLKQSLDFVRQRLSQEAERGKAPETRATAMLAILGILAGLIVPSAELVRTVTVGDRYFLYIAFGFTLLFLIKGIYYAMKILGVSKQFRLTPETVYDFQSLTRADALREEIASTIWELDQMSGPNTKKLFWLNRCQRNGVIAILLFVFFGVSVFVFQEKLVAVSPTVGSAFGAFGIVAWLISDVIAERFGIWGGK